MSCFTTFRKDYHFNPIIKITINPKVSIKLIFQKELAFFNSINWNATNKNLIAEIPIIRKTAIFEIVLEDETKAVAAVIKINKT